MNTGYEDTKKLTVDLRRESIERLNSYLTWGTKKHVFQCIVDDLNKMLEKRGAKVLGGLLAREIHLSDFLELEENDDA